MFRTCESPPSPRHASDYVKSQEFVGGKRPVLRRPIFTNEAVSLSTQTFKERSIEPPHTE